MALDTLCLFQILLLCLKMSKALGSIGDVMGIHADYKTIKLWKTVLSIKVM